MSRAVLNSYCMADKSHSEGEHPRSSHSVFTSLNRLNRVVPVRGQMLCLARFACCAFTWDNIVSIDWIIDVSRAGRCFCASWLLFRFCVSGWFVAVSLCIIILVISYCVPLLS